jgi:uncharacterized membrane protein YbhN (UPF0104 family)
LFVIYAGFAAGFIVVSIYFLDFKTLKTSIAQLANNPIWLLIMVTGYSLSFVCRAIAWRMYIRSAVSFSACLDALFYSLFINHLLPIKVGDAVRAGVILEEQRLSWDESIHSVGVMRMLDMLILGMIIACGAMAGGYSISNLFFWLMLASAAALLLVVLIVNHKKKLAFLQKHVLLFRQAISGKKGMIILCLIVLSWVLEASIVWAVCSAIGNALSPLQAIWVNSFTIAGQVFHFTPGGIGSYESTMGFALISNGYSWDTAYSVAVLSHGFKFAYSYAAGTYVWMRRPVGYRNIRQWVKRMKDGRLIR